MAVLTLDDWFKTPPADVPQMRALASLAAELGTNRSESQDSVWSGADYGGDIGSIRAIPGATLALSAEIQRVTDRHAVGGRVTVTDQGARVGADIVLTSEGLELA